MAKSKTPRKKAKAPVKRKRRAVKPAIPEVKRPVLNCHHPDIAHHVEEAFTAGGVTYYRFKKEYQMPTGRYKWVIAFLREVDLRMSLETANAYLDVISNQLNGSRGGKIDLGEIWKVVHAMRTRFKLGFEPETVKRLASVTYFDDLEDLCGYDQEHCRNKIKVWDEAGTLDFFLTNPIAELLNLNNFSEEALLQYMMETKEILGETLEPLSPSAENSSENLTSPSY